MKFKPNDELTIEIFPINSISESWYYKFKKYENKIRHSFIIETSQKLTNKEIEYYQSLLISQLNNFKCNEGEACRIIKHNETQIR